MNQEHYQNQNTQSYDVKYIGRCLMKNAIFILMFACLAGVFSYVFLDHYKKDTYTASVNLYVIPRDNASTKFNSSGISSAVSRCVSALNSDMMKEQMKKEEDADKLKGSLSAYAAGSTNIIVMSATSSSAESACRLLKAGIENYPKLSGYFQTGYLLKKIGSFEGNGITVNHANAPFSALKAAFLVLAAGCGLVGAMAVFTDKVHSVEQAQQLLDMDVFGALPFVKKKQEQKSILITDPRTSSQYAESVDKIVTKLRRKMHENHYKVLMVSSLKENDGKSTAAANLALNLVQRGKKVVLVDCDLRRSAVYKLFDIDLKDHSQLYDYLTGNCTLSEVLMEYGQDDRKFACILQKKAVSEPERLFDSERFEQLLKELSGHFDYVILDTAPIGIVRDAEIIAGYADSVFMVMKQDEVHAASVNDVIDILENAGSVVVGGALNMAKGEKLAGNGYHKYKYGSYYYGYAYGKDGQHAGK